MLRVTVVFRAEHYETLQHARRGRLKPEFQNKLGWLVGNLYSRIGTEDWQDHPGGQAQFSALVAELLEPTVWLPRDLKKAADRNRANISDIPRDRLLETLTPYRPPPPIHRAVERVKQVLAKLAPDFPQDTLEKLAQRLRNDTEFADLFPKGKGLG